MKSNGYTQHSFLFVAPLGALYKFVIFEIFVVEESIRNFSPIIIIGTNFWKLLVIIVRKNKPLAATPKRVSPSAMDIKKQISIIRIIQVSDVCFTPSAAPKK